MNFALNIWLCVKKVKLLKAFMFNLEMKYNFFYLNSRAQIICFVICLEAVGGIVIRIYNI